jgi:hypothetical protein
VTTFQIVIVSILGTCALFAVGCIVRAKGNEDIRRATEDIGRWPR